MTIKNKDLTNLPSYRAYNTYNSDESDITCDTCCASFQSFNLVYPGIHDTCKQLVKKLNYIKKEKTNDNLDYLSTYLFYWIHDNVTQFKIDLKSKYKDAMDILHSECNIIKTKIGISDNVCNLWDYKIDIENINKKKAFFEFFDDYETMREEITSSEGGDCNKYFDYIFDIAKIYKDFNTLCESDNNCNKFYISSQYPNPQVLLGLSSCSEIADTKGLSSELALLSSPVVPLDAFSGSLLSPVEQRNPPNFEYYHTIIIVVLSFFGIILMSFLIYRLTPIGPWIYNQVFKKKLIRNYFNGEDSQEFLEHTSDSLDTNSQKMDYNLRYYPS
ncbi:PIR Superfamily Protein [Plasmodium ovale wallikeri]|uniref:PIR Superfamily Protein n=2 Tax=Plasmodium ovale TaxID=36330 RepID=A0A1A9A8Q9_PLAOA|nr:PIR Superfamily Protein [Plasmodium ovale wallikeri]SBT55587.1 PIR Superfamily Protein [Plasmodium ovale wallikeri]SBT75586.1 Plasmodium vivax Vir protein, putative [Plasmodium ovale]